MIILDASSVMPWFFPDEFNEASEKLQFAVNEYGAYVPALWYLEIANSLLVATRRKRIEWSNVRQYLNSLNALPIIQDEVGPSRSWEHILEFAAKNQISAYDATYLELAVRRRLPLATLDKKLAEAARAEGVRIFGGNG